MVERIRALVRRLMAIRGYRKARWVFNRPLAPRGKRHIAVLLGGLLAIVVWQATFAGPQAKIDGSYKVTAASGVHYDARFTYFLYYLNLFPMVSMTNNGCASDTQAGCWDTFGGTPAPYNYEAAKSHALSHGGSLQQDIGWTWYAGDRGKIYLYLFDAWLKGAPWNPSPRPASRLAFICALSLLYAAMWFIRRPVLGAALVLFLGSNPFQLFEVNGRDNVFGLNISFAILMLAIHVPLLRRWRPHPNWVFAWPIGVGLLMATLRTVRSEPTTMLLAAAATYAMAYGLTKKRRAAMVVVLAVSFWVGGAYWNRHFIRKHNQAAEFVAKVGGHPYPTEIRLYHHVWHPIWCGLGDFGQKYGYVWNDHEAANYARPLMEAAGIYVPSGFFYNVSDPREFLDPDTKIYKKLPYDLPLYNDIIRDKVLHDIRQDPLWYLGVLTKRVGRILTMTSPVRISWATGWVTMSIWHALLTIPLLLGLLAMRSRLLVGITLFTIPSLTTALLVFSDLGITYYGVFHIIGFAVVVSVLLEHAIFWGRRWLSRRRSDSGKEPETISSSPSESVEGTDA